MAKRPWWHIRREYKNKAEEAFCKHAEKHGYTPMKRGWPDFICVNDEGKVIAVEVKDTATHPLKKEQYYVGSILREFGIPTFHWDPQSKKLKPIKSLPQRERHEAEPIS